MQMSFIPLYLTLLNSPYGCEAAQRKTRETSRWAASHVKIPPSVVNGLTACVLSPCTCLQSTSVLLVLAFISQPGRLTADPRKSDYWLGWTGHDGIASQTWITVKLGRPYGSLQRFVSGL